MWLRSVVISACRAAGVRVVPPHGLRGTHASLRRTVALQAVAQIGDALGHADHGKTAEKSYAGAQEVGPELLLLKSGRPDEEKDER